MKIIRDILERDGVKNWHVREKALFCHYEGCNIQEHNKRGIEIYTPGRILSGSARVEIFSYFHNNVPHGDYIMGYRDVLFYETEPR